MTSKSVLNFLRDARKICTSISKKIRKENEIMANLEVVFLVISTFYSYLRKHTKIPIF